MLTRCHFTVAVVLLSASVLQAGEPIDQMELRTAVERGVKLVEGAASRYPDNRQCFSCHHQTLPMLAITDSLRVGIKADKEVLTEQAEFTHRSYEEKQEKMREGQGVGGRAFTAAYGLWALELAGWKKDATTEAMVTYILIRQEKDGRWQPASHRPPLEESRIANTVLVIYTLQKFATDAQQTEVQAAITKATNWLKTAKPKSQEDHNFSLWGATLLELGDEKIAAARKAVTESQREDGGWAQLPDMQSDAYATGQALYMLRRTGTSPDDDVYQRGARFLLQSQKPDGSWYVKTRSKPIQKYFDNGDPHGKNQFISTPAAAWATAALAGALKGK